MHNSDDTPLSMFLMNLAFARGNQPDDRFVRGRIAIQIWLTGLALIVYVAIAVHSWIVGATGIVLLLFGLWLFTERADQVVALVRRRFPKK